MGIIAGEETTVEVTAGSHVGDIMIKPEEIGGSLVAIVHLDDGLAQVLLSTFVQLASFSSIDAVPEKMTFWELLFLWPKFVPAL